MRSRAWLSLIWLAAVGVSQARAALPATTFVHVRVKSVAEVVDTARFFVPIFKAQEQWKKAEAFIRFFAPRDPGTFLDLKKPLGVYVTWQPKRDRPDSPIIYLPLRDPMAFLKWVQGLPLELLLDKGIYQVKGKGLPSLFFQVSDSHAFFSTERSGLPEGNFPGVPEGAAPSLAQLDLYFKQIPERLKTPALEGFLKTIPGSEDLAEFATRLVEDSEKLEIKLDLDRAAELLTMDWFLAARPESIMAKGVRDWGAGPSRFHGFHSGSLLSLSARLPLADVLQEAGREMVKTLERTVDPRQQLLLRRLFQVLGPTFQAGTLDFGLAFFPADKEAVDIVGGISGLQGRRLENVIRDTFKDLPNDEREAMTLAWNHARIGPNRVHLVSPGSRGAKSVPVFATFGNQEVLVGLNLNSVKEALRRLPQAPPAGAPPIHLEVHLKTWHQLGLLFKALRAKNKKGSPDLARLGNPNALMSYLIDFANSPEGRTFSKRLTGLIPNLDDDRLRMRLSLGGGEVFHLRLEIHPRMLALFTLFADELMP